MASLYRRGSIWYYENVKWHKKTWRVALLIAIGAAAFQVAASVPILRGLVILPLAISFYLATQYSTRKSFSVGFVFGFLLFAPQLYWFYNIFEYFAFALWAIFAIWIALWFYAVSVLYTLKSLSLKQRQLFGCFCAAIIWFGVEYLRSEYFYLRFSWLTTGYIVGPQPLSPFVGVYGWSFLLMFGAAIAVKFNTKVVLPILTIISISLLAPWMDFSSIEVSNDDAPLIIGIQYEYEDELVIRNGLDAAIEQYPEVDLIVLSEYAFHRPPSWMPQWCDENDVHVMAGTVTFTDDIKKYFNSAIVWGPNGDLIFNQAKSQPVQFVESCIPANKQNVWESPWGKIGVGICFDSSYRRIMDSLVKQGAELIVIPAMDPVQWGAYEHELDARVCPIRAAEYGVPFVRVCSSGISQSIQAGGREISTVPMPGQGEFLISRLNMKSGSVPVDVNFAFPSAGLFLSLIVIGIAKEIGTLFYRDKLPYET
jgi:apolipoprotein N-acyltransferase